MAIVGVLLVFLYRLIVVEHRLHATGCGHARQDKDAQSLPGDLRSLFTGLFSSTSVVMAYVGSGFQLFIMASMIAWMPSFLNRYYGLPSDKAGVGAAAFILIGAVGMVLCGIVTDRVSRN